MPPVQTLNLAEAGEEIPNSMAAQQPVAHAAAPPPRQPVRQIPRWVKIWASGCGILFLVLALNAIYVASIYYTVQAISEPLPRGIINHTYRGFGAFKWFVVMIGIMVGIIDAIIIGWSLDILPPETGPDVCGWIFDIAGYAFLTGCGVLIIALPWIASPISSKTTYAHACDSDWLEIVLTPHTWKTAADRNIATFSLAQTHELLWTWTSNDPFQNDFNLVGLNSTTPSLLPSLSNITINHQTNELERAWCYDTTNQCAAGYVWPFDGLSFEVQFNGTVTRMRNRYRDWTFGNVPSVLLHRVDENGQLAERLMQTSVENPDACKQIKVCVSHAMRRRQGNIVDPDVLVAAYWLLHKQAVYARRCTKNKS